ncbi:NADH-quinone oxidoreductase subunit NuoG [Microbulbifer sp. SA54]|uniref:NADH-quinone oxidoreductase subunit NuoG n=1 Tax=Microbulbifer sp. SA54 TaxID=3401577 RepID=UPI003AACED14
MATITIDGRLYEVDTGQNLLSACLSLKKNLPYFCWHPAMGSVGACRQCAVVQFKDKDDHRGRLVMACMTPVKDGDRYSIEAPDARAFRAGIIENLMTNHPHDCPVCEEGGECHLQDMTLMTAHTQRRFEGRKRTHTNQYLGPFINHEMNRCITCYRCVRFYRDYAGGTDLHAFGRNHQIYFGRQENGQLKNGFSGNLTEVCPTGVFTDKTFSRHFVRKWDLQTAPSVCEHCGVGCNTAPGARDDGKGDPRKLRRVVNLYHRDINGYFLCDRGRFGYEYANSPQRLYQTLCATSEALICTTGNSAEKIHQPLLPGDAVALCADMVQEALHGKRRLIGVGSPRTSLENNFALQVLVGHENFFAGVSAREMTLLKLSDEILSDPRLYSPTTPEIERADAVIILGEDISNTAPRIALAVRQSARQSQRQRADALDIPLWQDTSVRELDSLPTPIFIAAVEQTDLDDIASDLLRTTPQEITGFASRLTACLQNSQDAAAGDESTEAAIAQTLSTARNPLIICGSGLLSPELLVAAAGLAQAVANQRAEKRCAIYLASPEANSLGLAQICPASQNLDTLPQRLHTDNLPTTLIALETDFYRKLPSSTVDELLASVQLVHLDVLNNATARRADLIFPAAATPESEGTLVNSAGLAQRHYCVYEGSGYIQESWRWLANVAAACAARAGGAEKIPQFSEIAGWAHVTQISAALAKAYGTLAPLAELGPDWNTLFDGERVARQPHRYSGRTALYAETAVAEQPPPQDVDAPMNFSMEGIPFAGRNPLQTHNWAPGWNSNQAVHKFLTQTNGELAGGSSGLLLQREAVEFTRPDGVNNQEEVQPETETLLPVPLYRLFGSGELSNSAEAITTVLGDPVAQFHTDDSRRLQLRAGDRIGIRGAEGGYRVDISDTAAPGCIGFIAGHTGLFPQKRLQPQAIEHIATDSVGDSG